MHLNRINTAASLSGLGIVLIFCYATVMLFGFCKIASAD